MKKICLLFTVYCSLFTLPLHAGWFSSSVAEYRWEVETSRPQSQEIPLYRRETVDLVCRAINYGSPMNLSNAVVVLHAATNGQPANTSYQITGYVGRASSPSSATNGYLTVRVDVDRALPIASSMAWVIEATDTNGVLARLRGTFKITGSVASSYVSPTAGLIADPAGAAQAVSNSLAAALQAGLSSEASARSLLGVALSNAVAIAATNLQAAIDVVAAASSNYSVIAAQQVVAPYTNGATLGGSAVQPAALADYLPKAGGSLDVAAQLRLDMLAWPAAASGTRRWWNRYDDQDNSLYWRLCDPDDGTTELGRWVLPWVWGSRTVASTTDLAGYLPLAGGIMTGDISLGTDRAIVSGIGEDSTRWLFTKGAHASAQAMSQWDMQDHNADTNAHPDRPTFAQATNIVSGYAAPSFPVYDHGTGSNVTFVLSNSVLYLFGN